MPVEWVTYIPLTQVYLDSWYISFTGLTLLNEMHIINFKFLISFCTHWDLRDVECAAIKAI